MGAILSDCRRRGFASVHFAITNYWAEAMTDIYDAAAKWHTIASEKEAENERLSDDNARLRAENAKLREALEEIAHTPIDIDAPHYPVSLALAALEKNKP